MTQMPGNTPPKALSGVAFATLLLIACMMGANHVAARFAFNDGVDVVTAVAFRSAATALVISALLALERRWPPFKPRHRRALPLIGTLVALQSLSLYAGVARLPIAIALIAFNTYPIWAAFWARVLYGQRAQPIVLKAMPLLLIGLALALDVSGAASGLGARAHWEAIGAGLGFALAAGAIFGAVLVLTQHEAGDLDGRVRTWTTMLIVAVIAGGTMLLRGGLHLPHTSPGWMGLIGLTALYGTAFTIMFTVLPRLGVVGNSAIMNVEPVFALVLAWALLDQVIAPIQIFGALIVVATVLVLGLRRAP